MEISKIELKILIKEFLTASNRILRASYEIYDTELSKFVRFLDTHEVISNFICICGEPEYDVEEEVKAVKESCGNSIFSLGTTEEKEVANIYAVIKYLAEHNINGYSHIFYGYSNSRKYQEKVNAFGDEFIRVLITHIETYLTKISIQMGYDENAAINISIKDSSVSNAQLNVASGSSSISASQTNCDIEQLQRLIAILLQQSQSFSPDDKQVVEECVDTITILCEDKPKKGIIKMALKTLKGIAGSTEFIAAVTAIVQFVEQYI